ncbi:unnamed protein product [Aspergillus oryzae RIB40]|uniref:DNA, SC138 n=1 Tax=Aspergillus oryzae (strain ATCC 42149 / RIB 40) TaxID=510516 RepID=Q2U1Q1_ASPOR|nr:unnamed protein product [Aspergillus oryzae RIB40]BAE64514.1 unnamed protein product [Aspergillus oryzae RIB40]
MSLDTGKLPVTRIHGTDLAHLRFTESERKEFIQLWLFFHYLLCRLDPRQPVEAYLPDVKDPDDNLVDSTQERLCPYFIIISVVITLMALHWLYRCLSSATFRLLQIDTLSPLGFVLLIFYFAGTAIFNFVGATTTAEKGVRAAQLALANLIPLYFSSGREFGAHILGISLEAYGIIHRTTGFMAALQAAIHVTIGYQNNAFNLSSPTGFNGLLVGFKSHINAQWFSGGCMLLSLLILPMVKRRVYEVFFITHLVCAVIALVAIWRHIDSSHSQSRRYILASLCGLTATGALQLLRLIYRNVAVGRKSVRIVARPYSEDIVQAVLYIPRPWKVRAGERINLGVPFLGLFYLFQAHPFTIAWWEEDYEGNADSISLMFRARTGFTRKVLDCLEPDREYWAWIDGPFGPSSPQNFGSSREIADFGHILMVTTGIGIAAQLPYIKELLRKYRNASVNTQTISLVWQLDRTGDWESARDWLQQLVKEDDGYVAVYDPLRTDSPQEPRKIGHHELISLYGGEVNWADILAGEMGKRTGKLLLYSFRKAADT